MTHAEPAPIEIFFLHFLGGSAGEWAGVTRALPPTWQSTAIDLPGFGAASAVLGYGVGDMADHVIETIRARRPRRFALVGHSMGAKVATVVARRAEDGADGLAGLSHLVLVAGSPPGPEPMEDDKRRTMLSWFRDGEAATRRQAEGFIDDNVHAPLPEAVRRAAVDDVLRTHRDAWSAWLTTGSREDWRERIGQLAVPTLVIAGGKDAALGPVAQRHATLPHFRDIAIEVLEGGAHLLPMEDPKGVAALIVAHLGRDATTLPAPYRALIQSARVSEGTRRTLLARLEPAPPGPSALSSRALTVLRTVAARVIPQDGTTAIDLVAVIDRALAGPLGDGWRFADLPPDLEAAERGVATLDAMASGGDFTALSGPAQDDALRQVAAGEDGMVSEGLLSASQMKLWFADLCSALTRAYVSHPITLARMGYSGIANGGDGPRKWSRTLIRAGESEPWEPAAEQA